MKKNKQPPINENMYDDFFTDGTFEVDLDQKYAKFLAYYIFHTGLLANAEKILKPNEFHISFVWHIMQIAKLYDSWQKENNGEIE
ncbi:MAG TPA: hypothetical protein PKI34_01180 [Bacteroidales bacterium]|nr:hypothetical protein [Bacteroidales bacterium]